MTKGFFITGTDTEVGKSWCTAGIMARLKQQGHSVVGMKPVASGCMETAEGLRNEDALLIQQQASVGVDYSLLNPYAFVPPIAPHVAAAQAGVEIELGRIVECFTRLAQQADTCVVEGVGGWQVPLNGQHSVADLAVSLKLPVILVVGLRLGCINHALLSATSIRASGCLLAGWIANTIDPDISAPQQTIDAITKRIDAPLLGVVPYFSQLDAAGVAAHLNV